MKTAFFSSDGIALDSMNFLKESKDFPLVCVVSNPDKPKGRGRRVSPNEASQWAMDNGIELLRPEGAPDDSCIGRLRSLGVEMIIVMAYGRMLKKNILEYGKFPCLNLHGSLLPELRGASPIETAIAVGMKHTGVSLMRVEPKMDSGAVCAKSAIPILPTDTSASLRKKLGFLSADMLAENLPKIAAGRAAFVPQDDSKATYTRKLDKDDLRFDFSMDAEILDARVRAFGRGIFEIGGEPIATDSVSCERGTESVCAGDAGKVLESGGDALRVACGRGVLAIKTLQKPCAKMLAARAFFAGNKIGRGSVLKSFHSRSLIVK